MDPHSLYNSRLAERRARIAVEQHRHIQIGNARLALGVAGAVIGWQAFVNHTWSGWLLLFPAAGLVALIIFHERVLRARRLAERAAYFYERGLARLEDRWAGTGEPGERFRNSDHVYADDFDLFGKGSLFELLSQARTRDGESTLANWLMRPSPPEVLRERQQAVAELRDATDLREAVFVLGEDARDAVNTEELVKWAETPVQMPLSVRPAAWALSALSAGAFALWQVFGLPAVFAVALVAVGGFGLWLRLRVLQVIFHVDEAVHDLGLLKSLLQRMEALPVQSVRLRTLQQQLAKDGHSASQQIARLHRLAELLDSRDNVAMRVIGPPLLYGTHLAFAVEQWRVQVGPHVRNWLSALGEFEALLSLGAYGLEHPDDPFPEFSDTLLLEGTDLGHPLLPASRCVRNSIRLDAELAMLVVSGSNMSGKSTYLRTIGVNVVLAMAGAPVRATRLTLAPLQAGASIRVNDSLQGGSSRFFAEILRLRHIVDLTKGAHPVVFFLDELLNGTNSHDRRIGAEGILKELLDRGAIGLITTHDLALTAIADALAPRARNVHFEDRLEAGKLHFDYKLRQGVVEKSNALELMRSIGLDV